MLAPPGDVGTVNNFGGLCVVKDELVAYGFCFMCRVDANDIVHARLSELTELQHKAIAGLIFVDPPPLTSAAWRALAKKALETR
jgi:hypothetical protein